jgi:CBS domain-containing protein
MRVEKIVRKDVLGLRTDETLDVAWRRMRDHAVLALHVTDSTGRLVGQLSERDLLARMAPCRSSRWWAMVSGATDRLAADYMRTVGLIVGDVMTTSPLRTIAHDATIEEAAALMRRDDVAVVPVIADDTCIGIVTRADVLDHLSWPTPTIPGPVQDAELERAMREGIESESWASSHPITVEAHHGVIRLTGVAGSPIERAALLAMARSLGSAGVEDRLIVLSRTGRHHTAPVI